MSRVGWLLTALLCILLVVGWYLLVFSPTSEDIDAVRAEIETVQERTMQELSRAAELREVRAQAPEAESDLALGRSLIPEDAAVPSLFRQMQQAADDAGARLDSISPSAPSVIEIDGVEYTSITVSLNLEATYFQLVDLTRRIEDPQLTARALTWQSATMSPSEFPTLSVSLTGEVFSRGVLEIQAPEPPPAEDAETDDEGDDGSDDLQDEVES